VIAYGGHLPSGEGSSRLTGTQKWKEYANASLHPTVAIAEELRHALFTGVQWSLEENEAGGAPAKRGVEVVQQGLLDAKLEQPWNEVAAKAANGAYFDGFSLHAYGIGRRPDGTVVFTELDARPPHTIEEWWRADPTKQRGPFVEVMQRISTGDKFTIPLAECLYVTHDAAGNSPEGRGIKRLVIERLRRLTNYEALEGSEVFSGMGGTPIARVPIEEINHNVPSGLSESEIAASRTREVSAIETVVRDRIKTPEKRQYVVLSSKTYQGSNPDTITNVPMWNIEILKGDLQGLADIRKIINDYDLGVARVLGVEFVLVGGNDSAGSYNMHESKVSMFAAQLTASMRKLAQRATQQLARKLCVLNGLDPDVACPTLVPSPIATEDVEKTARTLVAINMAQLSEEAKRVLYERLNVPYVAPEEGDLMLPRPKSPTIEDIDDIEDRDDAEDRAEREREPVEARKR
jgi:hypothetical protein